MKKTNVLLWLLVLQLLLGFVLASCQTAKGGEGAFLEPGPAQAAAAQTTALALSIHMTEQSLQLQATQAAATMLADQAHSTATAQTQATGTARADLQATSHAAAQHTAASFAYLQATTTASLLQTQTAQRTQLEAQLAPWQTFWRGLWGATVIASLIVATILIFQFLPWVQLKYFGSQDWNGKPITIIPVGKGRFMLADPSRALGPGLLLDAEAKEISSQGIFENAMLQAEVTARAQAAELLLAENGRTPASGRNGRRAMLQEAFHRENLPRQPYQLLSPEEPLPATLASPEALDIIEAEWRELDV